MEYFHQVSGWLTELNERSYGFVVNGPGISDGTAGKDMRGAFVSHPEFAADLNQPPKIISALEGVDPTFKKMAADCLKMDRGRQIAIDPHTGKRSTFLFAPVPSTKWMFVAVIVE